MSFAIQDLKIALSRNRAKTGVLAGLLAVAVFLVMRLLAAGDPHPAAAGVVPTAEGVATDRGGGGAPDMDVSVKESEQLWKVLRQRSGMSPEDAFSLNAQYYTPDPSARHPDVESDAPRVEKSPMKASDTVLDRSAAVRTEGRGLTLQSTYLGKPASCVINSQIVHLNDRVQGFKVIAIRSQDVVIEKEGVVLAIALTQ